MGSLNLKRVSSLYINARKNSRLSQKDVAQKAGIYQAELSKLERGIGNPSLATLEKIAKVYGKTIEVKLVDRMQATYGTTGIRQTVIDEIQAFARQYDISKVLLFGSRARGDFRNKSDIDLAISGNKKRMFMMDVDEKTSTLLMFDFVDLDSKPDKNLMEDIEKDGIVLYEKV